MAEHLQPYCAIHLCSLWPCHVFSRVTCRSTPWPASCVHSVISRHIDFPIFLDPNKGEKVLGTGLPDSSIRVQNGRGGLDTRLASLCSSSKKNEMSTRKTVMATGSLWSSLQRPLVAFKSNLTLFCRRNQLRLSSSEVSRETARKRVFQRRGFWLLVGSGSLVFAAHNRLWERKQRRKLRVKVEGVGRFFR